MTETTTADVQDAATDETAVAAALAVEPDVPAVLEGQTGEAGPEAAGVGNAAGATDGFSVHLENFEGPFDLLLGLISKHKLDVTEVALSQVTDEFIAHIRAKGEEWDLGQATEFLVVASTLLDLKAARLLPSAEVEDEEDLALLEARDLLFARLLQYRAYKDVSAEFARLMATEGKRFPRTVKLDPRFANVLPEVLLGLGPAEFAALAARAVTPKAIPEVAVSHIHAPRVSVREQGAVIVERLRLQRATTFRALTADCEDTLTVVARFLALLELFRDGAVAFEQVSALGELHIRWTGSDDDEVGVTDEFDLEPQPEQEAPPAEAVSDADARAIAAVPIASIHPHDRVEPTASTDPNVEEQA